jgi:hypothetical protein
MWLVLFSIMKCMPQGYQLENALPHSVKSSLLYSFGLLIIQGRGRELCLLLFLFPLPECVRQTATCDIDCTKCYGCSSYDTPHCEFVLNSL